MYSRNRIGPRTDPWGTPHRTRVGTDLNAPQRTKCVRRSTYELNHFNTQPYVYVYMTSPAVWGQHHLTLKQTGQTLLYRPQLPSIANNSSSNCILLTQEGTDMSMCRYTYTYLCGYCSSTGPTEGLSSCWSGSPYNTAHILTVSWVKLAPNMALCSRLCGLIIDTERFLSTPHFISPTSAASLSFSLPKSSPLTSSASPLQVAQFSRFISSFMTPFC